MSSRLSRARDTCPAASELSDTAAQEGEGERERERETDREKERKRERERGGERGLSDTPRGRAM